MLAVYRARNSTLRLFEKMERQGIRARIINTPRELSVGCGLSVEFLERDFNRVKNLITSVPTQGFAGIWRYDSGIFNRIY